MMKKLLVPADEAGWERLASSIVKANLKLAQMNLKDLEAALAAMGLDHHHKNISSKLNRGKFTAAFLLQVLVAAEVERIELPLLRDRH